MSLREYRQSVEKALEEIRVEYKKIASNDYILSGSLPQIQVAREKLLQYIAGVKEGKEHTLATGDSHPVSPQSEDKISVSSTPFEVQPQIMKLLQKVHKNTISKMEQSFAVKIVWKENTSQVWVHPARKTSNGNDSCKEGCEEFIDIYKNWIHNVSRNVIQLPSEAGGEVIDNTIKAFQEDYPAVCEREGNTVVIYAEKDKSPSFYRAFEGRLHSILKGNRHGKTTNPSSFNNQRLLSIPDSQPLGGIQLSNGVLFSLYQADITKVNVDAIVNAANERLQHGGGVAAAIVRNGGYQIQLESSEIVKRRGPIPVGDAVETSGGRLPCQYVIHTVGPRWNEQRKEGSKSLLRQACLASLNLAATRLYLSSIALTAISSGIFGMPKDICAQVIFKAVEEFSVSEYAEVSCLRDVRIVIIDEPTIRVFYEEFIKRYCSKGALPEGLSNAGHPHHKEKQDSLIANPSECVRKPPKIDSAGNGNQDSDKLKNNATNVEPPGQATTMSKESYETILSDGLNNISISSGNDDENAGSGGDGMGANGTNLNFPLKSESSGNKNASRKPAIGRGRGVLSANLAPTFSPGKEMSRFSSSPFSHGQNGRGEVDVPMTNANTKPSPPGLIVTGEGKDLAKQFKGAKGDNQETSGTDSVQSKDKSSASTSQGVDHSLKFYSETKANGEPATKGLSSGAQGKERNSSQSHDNPSSNHVRPGNSTKTDAAAAGTQNSQTSAGESDVKNSSIGSTGDIKVVHEKTSKNLGNKRIKNDTEPMDCSREEIRSLNQVVSLSSSEQLQTTSPSVQQSSDNEDNTVDSRPGAH